MHTLSCDYPRSNNLVNEQDYVYAHGYANYRCGSPREAKRSGGISVNPSRSRYEMVNTREHFSDFAYLARSFPAFEAEVIFIATDAGRATTLAGLKLSSVAIKSLWISDRTSRMGTFSSSSMYSFLRVVLDFTQGSNSVVPNFLSERKCISSRKSSFVGPGRLTCPFFGADASNIEQRGIRKHRKSENNKKVFNVSLEEDSTRKRDTRARRGKGNAKNRTFALARSLKCN